MIESKQMHTCKDGHYPDLAAKYVKRFLGGRLIQYHQKSVGEGWSRKIRHIGRVFASVNLVILLLLF